MTPTKKTKNKKRVKAKSKNKDFKAFLKSVCEFDYKNRMRFLNEFEEILTQEQMQEYLKKYKICESI